MAQAIEQNKRQAGIEKLAQYARQEGHLDSPIQGLRITRWDHTKVQMPCVFSPSLTILLQGKKCTTMGGVSYTYHAFDLILNSIDMPGESKVLEASPNTPLLCLSILLDEPNILAMLSELIPHFLANQSTHNQTNLNQTQVGAAADALIDVFMRLIDLFDKPLASELMAPLLVKEALARTLTSEFGQALANVYHATSSDSNITQAIDYLKQNYMHNLSVATLAAKVKQPVSSFHRQFKALTGESPLQYQKHLRLYEARRLMLTQSMDANSVARQVGYASAQQFNREYKRLFGLPPLQDMKRFKA